MAGAKYREHQASYLIRSLAVRVVEDEQPAPSKPVRAFVSVARERDREYVGIAEALSDEQLRQQVIGRALAELNGWRHRYDQLNEFSRVFSAIDRAQKRLGF